MIPPTRLRAAVVARSARQHTRSLDIQGLRYIVHQLAGELAKPDAFALRATTPSTSGPPGYWAQRKRMHA
jgi:hypothetical protein